MVHVRCMQTSVHTSACHRRQCEKKLVTQATSEKMLVDWRHWKKFLPVGDKSKKRADFFSEFPRGYVVLFVSLVSRLLPSLPNKS